MANEVLVKMGTPVCWADIGGDYSNTASGISGTHQMTFTGLADGDMWQGAKADLTATRAAKYAVKCCFEWAVAPSAASYGIEVWWSSSYSATAGTGNDGGIESTGADADWDGIAGGAEAERDEYKRHLTFVGFFPGGLDATAIIQVATINPAFSPPTRYGFPIIKNDSGQALHSDDVEMYIALIPQVDEVQ